MNHDPEFRKSTPEEKSAWSHIPQKINPLDQKSIKQLQEDLEISKIALNAVWDCWTKGGELSYAVKMVKLSLKINS